MSQNYLVSIYVSLSVCFFFSDYAEEKTPWATGCLAPQKRNLIVPAMVWEDAVGTFCPKFDVARDETMTHSQKIASQHIDISGKSMVSRGNLCQVYVCFLDVTLSNWFCWRSPLRWWKIGAGCDPSWWGLHQSQWPNRGRDQGRDLNIFEWV